MEDLLLSIIIPIYNQEKYLAKCLDSILENVLGEPCEVILIDDGSTDSSGDIIDSYAREHALFVVHHTENRGVSAARNLGLDLARGRYIAWVDPDDYISPQWYASLRPLLESGVDFVFFDMVIAYPDRETVSAYGKGSQSIPLDTFLWDLQDGIRIQSHLCSKVFRRTLWKGIRFPLELSYCEDFSVMHKVAVRATKIEYLHAPLYYYVQHPESITNDRMRELRNCVTGMRLEKERELFLSAWDGCRMNPVRTALWQLRLSFLWLYRQAEPALQAQYRLLRSEERAQVRRDILKLLCSSRLTWRQKVKAILVAFL